MHEAWEEIVPPLPPKEADRRLEEVRRTRHLPPEDLRCDTIAMGPGQKCVLRYLVRIRNC